LNATSLDLDSSNSGFFVKPIRSVSSSVFLFYDSTTGEITYGNSPVVSLNSGVTGVLPVANGGTGATTLTGILKGNGTSAVTAVTAPTGAIVGTSDVQTLTNKTLTSPTLTTPSLGVATATSINGATITSGTLNGSVTGINTGDQDLSSYVSKNYSVTNVNSDYSVLSNPSDLYAVDVTSGPITLTLPLISSLPNGGKGTFTISDLIGNASISNITISTGVGDTIFGLGSYLITSDYSTITLMSIPGTNSWIIK
jgi:hypothetical protein